MNKYIKTNSYDHVFWKASLLFFLFKILVLMAVSLSANHERLLCARKAFLLAFLAQIFSLRLFNLLALREAHFTRACYFLARSC